MNQIYQVINWYREVCMIAGYSILTIVLILAAIWLIRHF